jgi:hypothetical protein
LDPALDAGFFDPAREAGLTDAFEEGFTEALEAGFASAFDAGFADALDAGLAAALEAGLAAALEAGLAAALDAGLVAFEAGFEAGLPSSSDLAWTQHDQQYCAGETTLSVHLLGGLLSLSLFLGTIGLLSLALSALGLGLLLAVFLLLSFFSRSFLGPWFGRFLLDRNGLGLVLDAGRAPGLSSS